MLLYNEEVHKHLSHSLGKLIEWKQDLASGACTGLTWGLSHSLGKLIEWKHEFDKGIFQYQANFPTRWEN